MRHINLYRKANRPCIHWRNEEKLVALAPAYPLADLRRIASRVGISRMTVQQVIRKERSFL